MDGNGQFSTRDILRFRRSRIGQRATSYRPMRSFDQYVERKDIHIFMVLVPDRGRDHRLQYGLLDDHFLLADDRQENGYRLLGHRRQGLDAKSEGANIDQSIHQRIGAARRRFPYSLGRRPRRRFGGGRIDSGALERIQTSESIRRTQQRADVAHGAGQFGLALFGVSDSAEIRRSRDRFARQRRRLLIFGFAHLSEH